MGKRTALRRPVVALVGLVGMAICRLERPRPRRKTSSPRRHLPTTVDQRLAGRHLQQRRAGHGGTVLGRHPVPVLRKRRRPSAGRLHPVHRRPQNRNAGSEEPDRRTEKSPRRPAPGPQRQPAGDANSARWRPSKAAPRRAIGLPGIQSRRKPRHRLGPRHGPFAPGRRRSPKSPSTTSNLNSAHPALFGLELAGNEVFLKASVDWAGDYHEGFTIDIPPLPFGGVLSGGLVLKNRLPFNGRAGDGTFITTPDHLLRPGNRTRPRAHLLDLPPGGVETGTGKSRATPSRPAPNRRSSRRCRRAKNRSTAQASPTNPTAGLEPNTTETDSPAGATTEVEVPHILGGDRTRELTDQGSEAGPAGRARPQRLRRKRPAGLQRRTVRQGHRKSGRLPARVENRHGLDRNAAAAGTDHRRRLRRPAAQPRSRPPATSTGSSSTASRPNSASRCG